VPQSANIPSRGIGAFFHLKTQNMKEKILTVLKTKYSNLGFSSKVLDGIASSIEKSVTDESQIETAVGGIESILKVFQSDFDRARTEYGTLKGQYDELKKKAEASSANEGGQNEKNELDKEPEWFTRYKQEQEERYATIKSESEALKAEKVRAEREDLFRSAAKAANVSDKMLNDLLGLATAMNKEAPDASEIKDRFSSIQSRFIAAGLEGKESAFPLSTSESQSKEEAKAWAANLPDKN
jgi:hypothetical protein